MPLPRISAADGDDAVRRALSNQEDRSIVAMGVRYLLQVLADEAPGNSVEVRVPPFGAVQCIEGPGHTRGTPPNVVETDALTWLEIAAGAVEWAAALGEGRIAASGSRADLSEYLPLAWELGAAAQPDGAQ
jgi:hypothetical protein